MVVPTTLEEYCIKHKHKTADDAEEPDMGDFYDDDYCDDLDDCYDDQYDEEDDNDDDSGNGES